MKIRVLQNSSSGDKTEASVLHVKPQHSCMGSITQGILYSPAHRDKKHLPRCHESLRGCSPFPQPTAPHARPVGPCFACSFKVRWLTSCIPAKSTCLKCGLELIRQLQVKASSTWIRELNCRVWNTNYPRRLLQVAHNTWEVIPSCSEILLYLQVKGTASLPTEQEDPKFQVTPISSSQAQTRAD